MQTFDQHLADLVQADEVEFEVALAAATRPSDFELKMKTFRRRSAPRKKVTSDEPDGEAEDSATTTLGGLSNSFDFLGGGAQG